MSDQAGEKLADALELADLAERMVRARLRREHPGASEEDVDALVLAWLHARPGAENGDAPGRCARNFFDGGSS